MIDTIEREIGIADGRARKLERVLLPLIGASVALFVGSIVYVFALRVEPYAPISYTTQQIAAITDDGRLEVPEVEGVEAPSVYLDELVPTLGDVCNSANVAVKVSGGISWERLTPRGFRVSAGRGTNEIEPGCRSLAFENMIPEEVRADVEASDVPELWQIAGVVQIDEPNGGTTQWRTESFWIVPRESGTDDEDS